MNKLEQIINRKCLICLDVLKGNKTREHIIPRWIIKKYNLQDQYMDVISVKGDKKIDYTKNVAKICKSCNNEFLGSIEEKIKNNTATELEEFIWMAKIFILRWARTMEMNDYYFLADTIILLTHSLRYLKSGVEPIEKYWTLLKIKIEKDTMISSYDFGNTPFGQFIVLDDRAYIFMPVLLEEHRLIIHKSKPTIISYFEFLKMFYIYSELVNAIEYRWTIINNMVLAKRGKSWQNEGVINRAMEQLKNSRPKIYEIYKAYFE